MCNTEGFNDYITLLNRTVKKTNVEILARYNKGASEDIRMSYSEDIMVFKFQNIGSCFRE